MEEYLEIVNEEDRIIGLGKRSFIHKIGALHRAVHIFVFDLDGRLYLGKRSQNKDTHPLKWVSSASGHVDPKETYEKAAYRELKEELGLELPLNKVFKLKACPQTEGEHVVVYQTITVFEPFPNRAEIEEGRFFSLEEISKLLTKSPEIFTPSFRYIFKLYKERCVE